MQVRGILNVDKWIEDSPYKIYESENTLHQGLTKIGSIGYYNELLWYRKDGTTVVPLISLDYLNNVIDNLDLSQDVINNIVNNIINEDFITNLVENISFINSIITNQDIVNSLTNSILSNLNVEVTSIKNKQLFFAFNPSDISSLLPNITLPPLNSNCTLPESVKILGNMLPTKGSTETYTLDIPDPVTYLLTYTISGGVINTDKHNKTIQVTWDNDYNGLASISVGVGCSISDIIYDFNFFVLS
jgi:hypothetical protein